MVTLSPFYIAKYETTYELWYTVRQWAIGNGYSFANRGCEGNDGTVGNAPENAAKSEPVTAITWRDAVVWCNAYSEMSGKEPVYRNASDEVLRDSTASVESLIDLTRWEGKDGYRLPTEAEWEYAAHGGGTPPFAVSFAYKWAETNDQSALGNYAWYNSNSLNATHQVGLKMPNGLGLYDMTGNVYELCWDWNGTVGTETVTNPTGSGLGSHRVSRGGGRDGETPDHRKNSLGFRVVTRP